MIIILQVGDSVPNVDLFEDAPTNKVNLAQLSSGKKVILFAVPGAFTPGCSKVSLFLSCVHCNIVFTFMQFVMYS